MADTLTSSNDLKMTWQFDDGDTRIQTIANPRSDLTATDIKNYRDFMAGKSAIIGDKTGAALSLTVPMKEAYVEEKTKLAMEI